MEIKSRAWNPSEMKTMNHIRWHEPECYKDPVNATDHAINLAETALKISGCNLNVKTTITISLEEYRLLISEAQKKAKEEGYKEGREEAWDLTRRLVTSHGTDIYTGTEFDSVFGSHNANTIFGMPVEEALAKDKAFQEKKKTLHVGDEVEFDIRGKRKTGYVTNLIPPAEVRVLTKEHGTFTVVLSNCTKTGNHSDEIEKAMVSFEEGEC